MNTAEQTFREGPWPEIILRSFFISSSATSENLIHGSWNRLLNTLFPPDTIFEVVPQRFPSPGSHDSNDLVFFLVIYAGASPVFIVEMKPPKESRERAEADFELRRRFLDCSSELQIPVLHGVSAFGTKMAFYKYDKASGLMEPAQIPADMEGSTNTAPREWWCWDILEEEGANKFREVVADVKMMCEAISL